MIAKTTSWHPIPVRVKQCCSAREIWWALLHAPALLGGSNLRLLCTMVDHRLTCIPHVLEIKKNFATKLDLLKRSRFLPTKFLLGFYFKVILPSVQYGLILWGAGSYSDLCCSIERLHCRAARIIFNLPKDIASWDVLERDHWPTLTYLLTIKW